MMAYKVGVILAISYQTIFKESSASALYLVVYASNNPGNNFKVLLATKFNFIEEIEKFAIQLSTRNLLKV
jgi:hypothetical protein